MVSPRLQAAAASTRRPEDVIAARARVIDYTDGAHAAVPVTKLVKADTDEEVTLPHLVKAWDGSHHWIERFKASRFQGNPGYVYTRMNETFTPSTFGLKIVVAA